MKNLFTYISICALSAWIIGFFAFNYQINSYPYDSRTTQAIIALTGGRNRISEATKLLNDGQAEKLFISGVSRKVSLQEIKNRNGLKISTSREISIGNQATNTIENAKEAKEWIEQNHIKSIRLVTSNYHLPRSIIEFRTQNPSLQIIPHPVYSEKVRKKWWKGWRSFKLIFAEYNKFLCVYARTHLYLRGLS